MKKKIAIIGLGYVGLPLAVLCAQKKYSVFGIDNNKRIVEKIIKGESHLNDKKLNKKIKKLVGSKYFFVSNNLILLKNVNYYYLCIYTY